MGYKFIILGVWRTALAGCWRDEALGLPSSWSGRFNSFWYRWSTPGIRCRRSGCTACLACMAKCTLAPSSVVSASSSVNTIVGVFWSSRRIRRRRAAEHGQSRVAEQRRSNLFQGDQNPVLGEELLCLFLYIVLLDPEASYDWNESTGQKYVFK